jgi:hypothetical protein
MSSLFFFCVACCFAAGTLAPLKSRPPNPFIKSSEPEPAAAAPLLSLPKMPIKSSIVLVGAGGPDGDSTRCGVPESPSKPEEPTGSCSESEAGAAPSKSMSRRFSTLLCDAEPPATAAAAAIGFSRASCFCSLNAVRYGFHRFECPTYSIAAFCIASAPNFPWPRNVSGGL